jgi:predicted transcriptional regulator
MKSAHSGDDPFIGLLVYRSTPIFENLSPAELLMGRKIRSNLPITHDMLKVENYEHVKQVKEYKKKQQKVYHDKGTKVLSTLEENDVVRIRDKKTNKWFLRAKVVNKIAPRSYVVRTESGAMYRRNIIDLLATREVFVPQAQEDVIPMSQPETAPYPIV